MHANGKASVERGGAMLEEGDGVRRRFRLKVCVDLIGPQNRAFDVRDGLVEHCSVISDRKVAIDGVRQPDTIVGDSGSNSASGRRMPPVLHVSFDELMCGRLQDVLSGQLALCSNEGDDILQLVAEPVGTPRLVERRPRPQSAGQGLIDQPMVQHDVHRPIRRAHLDRSLGVIPIAPQIAQGRFMIL